MYRLLLIIYTILFLVPSVAVADESYDSLMRVNLNRSSAEILRMADAYNLHDDEKSALVLYMMVSNRHLNTESDKNACVKALLSSGDIYYKRGHYTKALSLFIQGLKECEQSKSKYMIIKLYKGIGDVYFMFKDYEQAIEYYKKGYSFCKKSPDNESTFRLLINLSYTYYIKGDVQNMKRYYDLAIKTPHQQNPAYIFYERLYGALIDKIEHRYNEAERIMQGLLVYARQQKMSSQYICSAYEELYSLYEQKGDRKHTEEYLKLCLDEAEKSGELHLFSETLIKLAKISTEEGNLAMARYYSSRYQALVDSTFNLREFSVAKNEQFVYEMDKIDKDIATLNAAKESDRKVILLQRIVVIVSLIVVALLVMLIVIVFRQNKNLRNSYYSLYILNRKLHSMHSQIVEATLPVNVNNDKLSNVDLVTSTLNENSSKAHQDSKYMTSNLAEDKRKELIDNISLVMETTQAYAEDDFSLDRLAELTNSNSRYVSQVINDYYQKNFSNFVNEYRVRLACNRLTDESYKHYSIRGIGRSVGYKSNTTFVNVFRKVTGITPSAYQKIALVEAKEQEK